MSETRKTAFWLGAALVLLGLAWVSTPRTVTLSVLQDRGAAFFPFFTDPNAATSLEIVEFDEQTSVARPFKVLNRDGKWTIPSRFNYPADASNRLSQIAAAVTALKKDDVAGESVADQETCDVLDPLDETLPTPKGRGTRITVRGQNDRLLADVIVGRPLDGRPSLRYVRLPEQKRTYVAKVGNLDISTKFDDWIERDLLQVDRGEIDKIVIRSYSLDRTGNLDPRDMLVLTATGKDLWIVDGMGANEEIDTFKMNLLVTKLDDLTIVDVRPKPVGLTATLSKASTGEKLLESDVAELAAKGFYFSRDGRLLSNKGDVMVHTTSGVFYTLRFGEVVPGTDQAVENRYLFISVGFDPTAAHLQPGADIERRLALLRARFAPWYYVISDDSFKKIRLQRQDLLKPKTASRKTQT